MIWQNEKTQMYMIAVIETICKLLYCFKAVVYAISCNVLKGKLYVFVD